MRENRDDVDESGTDDCWVPARYPIRISLPDADAGPKSASGTSARQLDDAKEAIRREFRDSVKWKRLRCRTVDILSQSEAGTIYVLEVGHAVEFDWTWEGAIAFRPLLLKEDHENSAFFSDWVEGIAIDDSILWSGEILEVDEATGRIYVMVADPEHPPTTGSFYVRPFEFLGFLHSVYHEPAYARLRELLPGRLRAAEGGLHPEVDSACDVGLPELRTWWSKAWSILWGPPGTGKTYTTGRQVAAALADPSERLLVVSTTNRATDAAARAIGRAATQVAPHELARGALLRIGKGVSYESFVAAGLTAMLSGTETEQLAEIEQLARVLARSPAAESKAVIRQQIRALRQAMRDSAQRNFVDSEVRVVVATAFRATTFLKNDTVKQVLEQGVAPFTTIFVDEAGLISRAAVAALSLLASRRVVLVGDSKQLAPISRISRILPTNQMTWLAHSGLSHLVSIQADEPAVHVLQEQRRMHEDVCSVVSAYQYDGFLTTAREVTNREYELPEMLRGQPRAVWYVLDDEKDERPVIRASRGPGNRSWIRTVTSRVLERLFLDASLRVAKGMFIAPFKAQAKEVAVYFARNGMHSWSASTVHSQQGAEADIVIFDTVNAGSYSWPYDEWKRLVNVALSRSREAVIVLSSRAEMDEPYLRPLVRHLSPQVLRKQGKSLIWEPVPAKVDFSPPGGPKKKEPSSLGRQLAQRKELRPVLSQEQERLCELKLDGKPRLVRGVAGSGKTVVLAHWLMQTVRRLAGQPNVRIWAVFANRSLQSLIGDSIEAAWAQESGGLSFPWERVSLRHIREILDVLLPEVGLSAFEFKFDYDRAAAGYLSRKSSSEIVPRCDALFIDEAQDLGPSALKLLTAIVRPTDESEGNSRSVNIFYDNAQNIYGRGTPTWSELGLDMRGRSTVMKESFRSTRPITEFALNVLYRLQPPDNNPDHRELVSRGLIERTVKSERDWWTVRFNQIDGPKPILRQYVHIEQEFAAIADYCRELIQTEGVQPSDICLLYNGPSTRYRLENQVAPRLADLGVELSIQTNKPFERNSRILLATTPHSFKGYDSEVVIIPAADQYTAASAGVLASSLYVAMTRARSILAVYAQKLSGPAPRTLYEVLQDCYDCLYERPDVEPTNSPQDDLTDILERIGDEHREWLVRLWQREKPSQEPLMTEAGEIVAEPLFWFKTIFGTYACFGRTAPRPRVQQRLDDLGIRILAVGAEPT